MSEIAPKLQFGDRLEIVRGHLKRSLQEFADDLHLSRTGYYNLKNNLNPPSYNTLQRLCDMGISSDWLITGEGSMMRQHGDLPNIPDMILELLSAMQLVPKMERYILGQIEFYLDMYATDIKNAKEKKKEIGGTA